MRFLNEIPTSTSNFPTGPSNVERSAWSSSEVSASLLKLLSNPVSMPARLLAVPVVNSTLIQPQPEGSTINRFPLHDG